MITLATVLLAAGGMLELLVTLVVVLLLVGLLLFGISKAPFIPDNIKTIAYWVVIVITAVCVVVYVVRAFGLLRHDIPVPQI